MDVCPTCAYVEDERTEAVCLCELPILAPASDVDLYPTCALTLMCDESPTLIAGSSPRQAPSSDGVDDQGDEEYVLEELEVLMKVE